MRKLLAHRLVQLIAATTFCLATTAHAAVTVLGWPGGPEETALRSVAKSYNARADVAANDKVDLIFFSRDGFYDKLQADLAAGSTAFDACMLATYSIGRYAPFLKPLELGNDADKVLSKTVLSTMQYNGRQYGIPTDISLHFLYTRKDLIDKLLSDKSAQAIYTAIAKKYLQKTLIPRPVDEWTWDDYAATALYFTKSINPQSPVRYGTVLQLKNLLFNVMVFQSLPHAYGGNWMDKDGKITVNSDAYKTALKLYKTLLDAKTTPKDSLSYEFPEANSAFSSGQVATMLQWNAAAPDLTDPKKSPRVANSITLTAPPKGPMGRFTHMHSLGLGMNAKARNPEGTTKFLRWLATPEAMTVYAEAGGSPGLTGSTLTAVTAKRPDLVPLGKFATEYGFVMNGGSSAKVLSVYELQAKEFTGYLAGKQSLDKTLENTTQGMAQLLKP